MSRRDHYAPKHRIASAEPAFKKRPRTSVLFSGVAVVATGVAVSAGALVKDEAPADPAVSAIEAAVADRQGKPVSVELIRDRASETSGETSRSDRRTALAAAAGKQQPDPNPREIARAMLADFGFSSSEFSCLDALYVSESDWEVDADNHTSSAYGIPQALTELHELPSDYRSNPTSQIRWGLGYIRESYGTPCAAWEFKQANDFY